ncbi:hypothetical protein F751_0643 [Auxenochlorella protothecoides]|uniref:Uncharacterized protein n=1 Tax=Auxenochlorella protothecoides TaxID=3075 RepID=A0A087SQF3_AUXPR|nr:hypothetical protein F751_0643 [Auxenochlorella protothecoides]KFM27957.1 hypothetical protein F751_0643 [Auxenochlorella protothecoides]
MAPCGGFSTPPISALRLMHARQEAVCIVVTLRPVDPRRVLSDSAPAATRSKPGAQPA